jgi:uncharacterized protein YegL
MSNYDRRLPVYLLLDCSESMAGSAFEAVNSGIKALLSDLRTNPMALETVAISIITFGSSAKQVTPLTDILKFQIPNLVMGSGTVFGAALDLTAQCMEREVVKTSSEIKGDYKPFCYIFTDGEPTDEWKAAADRFKMKFGKNKANIIAVACGEDACVENLRYITENIIIMKEATPKALTSFFKWVSASVSAASMKIDCGSGIESNGPRMDKQYMEVADEGYRNQPVKDRFVFLHSRCIRNKKFYIMRYEKQSDTLLDRGKYAYKAMGSHPLEDFDFDSLKKGENLMVSTSQLLDDTVCPYCGNIYWAMCECGHVFCIPSTGEQTCPWCSKTTNYEFATFDVKKGRG